MINLGVETGRSYYVHTEQKFKMIEYFVYVELFVDYGGYEASYQNRLLRTCTRVDEPMFPLLVAEWDAELTRNIGPIGLHGIPVNGAVSSTESWFSRRRDKTDSAPISPAHSVLDPSGRQH